ncbi:NHL repeat-containing protein [candidate division KSB1 bacterium]|nr:NHL repeat-containing protein [candidate division KSB1 bacterium]
MKCRRLFLPLLLILIQIELSIGQHYDPTTLVFPNYLHTYGIRKATKFHLFMFLQNRVKFRNPQALAVVRLRSWDDLSTDNDDDEVTVFGVNSGQNNVIFNSSMTSLGVYGLNETGLNALNAPYGIAANRQGDVYIADTGNHRVVRFYNPGDDLKFSRPIGSQGTSPGQFTSPIGVALDSGGDLYVTDRDNHRIQVFDKNDRFLRQFGAVGNRSLHLISPTAIAVIDAGDDWNFHRANFIIVIDSLNKRIQKLSMKGKLLSRTDALKFGYPDANLQWLAIDYYGQIYATDNENHCIHKFDLRLKHLTKYGRKGTGDKEFISPTGITIYRRFGQVFVAEEAGAQYYWIGVDVFNFKVIFEKSNQWVKSRFFLTEPSFITADVYDSDEEFVTRICRKKFMLSGFQYDYWRLNIKEFAADSTEDRALIQSLKYTKLQQVPPGKYRIRYKFEPTYSSYHYFFKEKEENVFIEY